MTTILACANLDWSRSVDTQQGDLATLRSQAVIVCTQEDKVADGEPRRERIRTHRSVQTDGRGSILAALDRLGYRIRFRRWTWVDADLPGIDLVRVICGHMPPGRMGRLRPAYAARLRGLVRRSPHPCIVAADWNEDIADDPADLVKTFGGKWYGRGIDGFWVHPALVPAVEGMRAVPQTRPHGFDHPFVFLTLGRLPAPPKETPVKFPPPSPPVIGGHPNKHSGTDNHPINRVVIHSAVMPCETGRARQLGAMNQTSTTGSWHYATDPAETFQCSYDRYVCWHAPPNPNSAGIEMADTPGPLPSDEPRPKGLRLLTAKAVASFKSAGRAWRWARKPQRAMLRRAAHLTAELCLANDLPLVFLSARALRRGRRGITTHANVSAAWGQSTHWDPGYWPRAWFMVLVRRHAKKLRAAATR